MSSCGRIEKVIRNDPGVVTAYEKPAADRARSNQLIVQIEVEESRHETYLDLDIHLHRPIDSAVPPLGL